MNCLGCGLSMEESEMGVDLAGKKKQYHGYQARCVELLLIEAGKKDRRIDALMKTLDWIHRQHLASAIHGPCSICMAVENAKKDTSKEEADRREAPVIPCSNCGGIHGPDCVKPRR